MVLASGFDAVGCERQLLRFAQVVFFRSKTMVFASETMVFRSKTMVFASQCETDFGESM